MLAAGPSSSIARCSSKSTSSRTVSGVGDAPREGPDAATVDSACAADPLVFIGSADKATIIAPAKAKTRTCLRVELPLPAIMPRSTPRPADHLPLLAWSSSSFGVREASRSHLDLLCAPARSDNLAADNDALNLRLLSRLGHLHSPPCRARI